MIDQKFVHGDVVNIRLFFKRYKLNNSMFTYRGVYNGLQSNPTLVAS